MSSEDLLYTLALLRLPRVGLKTAKKLLARYGTAKALFEQSPKTLSQELSTRFLAEPISCKESYLKEAKTEIAFMNREQISCWYIEDEDYPQLLKHCIDAPVILFSKGNINLKNQRLLSIVGTRRMTAYGKGFLEEFIQDIKPYQPVIVSGLAYGVDITAQILAMHHGLQTLACLGHGLHHIYPATHRAYSQQIQTNGGLLSDFWSTDAIIESNFVSRNRIIAGLSEGTIIVESADRGGAMLTADMAWSYDREVLAVPGRTSDRYSKGCNHLIKDRKAQLITSAADVVKHLNWDELFAPINIQKELFVSLTAEEQKIVDYLERQGKGTIDVIARECDIRIHKLSSLLVQMELQGLITPLPGKKFELKIS